MPKIDTANLRNLKQSKEKLEAEIELLIHLKRALCVRELTNEGRAYVNKLINQKRHDVRTIESKISSGENVGH